MLGLAEPPSKDCCTPLTVRDLTMPSSSTTTVSVPFSTTLQKISQPKCNHALTGMHMMSETPCHNTLLKVYMYKSVQNFMKFLPFQPLIFETYCPAYLDICLTDPNKFYAPASHNYLIFFFIAVGWREVKLELSFMQACC